MADREPLATYKAKRDFTRTSEPADGGERGDGRGDGDQALGYVIHKHWASRLHYDLRLELDGVMLSWAVPKGPSYDPKDKRMAVHVEDHPISYSSFEGTIPAGQYGAGKVIVWDKGFWRPVGDAQRGLRDGDLKFELFGHKLQGRWVLVRMKGKGEKHEPWLLIKEKDALVRPAAEFSVVDEMPDSVAALKPPALPSAPAAAAVPAPADAATASASGFGSGSAPTGSRAKAKPKSRTVEPMPDSLAPQLATLVAAAPADAAAWLFEIKFDGYRLLARVDGGPGREVKLFTRNGHDWTDKLGPLHAELVRVALPSGWYDGEIVVHNEHGLPDFGALQRAFDPKGSRAMDEVVFYLFDLPWCDGQDLRAEPLHARRARLEQVLAEADAPRLRFSAVFDAPAANLVASACQLGLEGLIGKQRDSPYRSGRSAQWIKLKCAQRQEFVVGGWTDPQGGRNGFGSLMLGVHDADGALQYAGNVGSGFDEKALAAIKRELDALAATKSPFAQAKLVTPGKPHWVEPTLVAEVSFGEWTHDGHVRHAVFRGLRNDKPARQIVREEPRRAPATAAAAAARKPSPANAAIPASKLKVTHGDRLIDAQSGITKIELVRYFDLVGSLMTSHLKARPVSLLRAPDGVAGELFFQKHLDTAKYAGLRDAACAGSAPAIEVATREGLLSLAQWNAIELHTANMTARRCDAPDRMIFDLDPGEGVGWPHVQEAAQLVRAFLDQLGLPAFLKTSGGKGLHVVVPVKPALDFDTVKAFSQAIVEHMSRTIPQRFVARSGPKNRVGKIFIDYLRNGEAATTVCAWSPRARPGMGISVPVTWDELAKLRSGDHWTVRTAHERLDQGNAPWDGYVKGARALGAAMKKLGFVGGG